jgi:hypothetical protein
VRVLTPERFEQAIRSVERGIDRGRLTVRFGCGNPATLRAELARFQNQDGGYGNRIEPDFWLPDSSPMATTIGLQFLAAADAPAAWPEVRRAVAYLAATFDEGLPGWEPTPPAIDDHPRAPWWAYRPPGGFEANPGAEALGWLLSYPEIVPADVTTAATGAAVERLGSLGDEMEAHELLCWLRLAGRAADPLRSEILEKARAAARRLVTFDRDAWDEYVPGPLWVAPAPDAPLFDLVADHVDAHLDHLVAAQQDDGSWAPTWTWGADPDWPEAERLWHSPLTVQAIETLGAYGRIEGYP